MESHNLIIFLIFKATFYTKNKTKRKFTLIFENFETGIGMENHW